MAEVSIARPNANGQWEAVPNTHDPLSAKCIPHTPHPIAVPNTLPQLQGPYSLMRNGLLPVPGHVLFMVQPLVFSRLHVSRLHGVHECMGRMDAWD